jgi:succinate dehydrogenase / fumarate reductase, iron-sulfur subunit
MADKVKLRIQRRDGPDAQPRWESFEVESEPMMNVISCLQAVQRNPVTVEGKEVAPVIWDCSCLEEICGACTMVINGRVRQACSALVDQIRSDPSQVIELRPMSKFPVVRDLVVDRSAMFEALKTVHAWIDIDGTHDLGFGPRQSGDDQDVTYPLSKCMTCGCCVEACPNYNARSPFLGPQVVSQVRLFNMHPSGKMHAHERLETLMGIGGIAYCGKSQNCVEVCPKEIPLTESLAAVNRDILKLMFTRWLRR